jgi:hypothetical protein
MLARLQVSCSDLAAGNLKQIPFLDTHFGFAAQLLSGDR